MCAVQEKTLTFTFLKDEMPTPKGKKTPEGKNKKRDLFHIPLQMLHFQVLEETSELTRGWIFQRVHLYPHDSEQDVGSESLRFFEVFVPSATIVLGGSDVTATMIGAIPLNLDLQG